MCSSDLGSIQNIEGIPDNMKELYKTVWEIKQKNIIEMARDRQPFIDQSQSMNLFLEDFSYNKLLKIQIYAWKQKLKTGSYYIRSRPVNTSQKFTISPEIQEELKLQELERQEQLMKTLLEDEEEICLMCQ